MNSRSCYKLIKIITMAACLAVLFSAGAGAASKAVSKRIAVIYQNIKIYVDGKQLSTTVEPFILDGKGTAMVPIRVISEALGKPVTWDEASSSIYLGKVPEGITGSFPERGSNTANKPQGIFIEQLPVLRNVGPFYQQKSRNFLIAGREFANGVGVELAKDGQAEVILDLKGGYTYLDGYLGIDDEARNSSGGFSITIYNDEVEEYKSHVIKPAYYPYYIKADVKGVKRLKITVSWQKAGIGEYDKIIAALADFKFYK